MNDITAKMTAEEKANVTRELIAELEVAARNLKNNEFNNSIKREVYEYKRKRFIEESLKVGEWVDPDIDV